MEVAVFKDRKATNEKYNLAAIDDSSLEGLVKSIGRERAVSYIKASLRAAFAHAHTKQVKDGKTQTQIAEWAKSWKPSASTRKKKTPEQKVRDYAAKMGIGEEKLRQMLDEQKAAKAA